MLKIPRPFSPTTIDTTPKIAKGMISTIQPSITANRCNIACTPSSTMPTPRSVCGVAAARKRRMAAPASNAISTTVMMLLP